MLRKDSGAAPSAHEMAMVATQKLNTHGSILKKDRKRVHGRFVVGEQIADDTRFNNRMAINIGKIFVKKIFIRTVRHY